MFLLIKTIFCVFLLFHFSHFINANFDFFKRQDITNKAHILEHAENFINIQEEDLDDEEKLFFHYFKLHDLDQNHKLDGLELSKAMTHHNSQKNTPAMSDDSIMQIVDVILKDDDTNDDGYIDYTEFINSQKE